MSAVLKEILAETRERRWESGRRGEGKGGEEVAGYGSGSKGTWYAGTYICDSWVINYLV